MAGGMELLSFGPWIFKFRSLKSGKNRFLKNFKDWEMQGFKGSLVPSHSSSSTRVFERSRGNIEPGPPIHLLAHHGPHIQRKMGVTRTVSEYCSARVSRVGLSSKQAPEPYSDNLLNRTWNPSEPYSDKEIPFRRALRRLHCSLGSQLGIPQKLGLSPLGTVHATVLGHLLSHILKDCHKKRNLTM